MRPLFLLSFVMLMACGGDPGPEGTPGTGDRDGGSSGGSGSDGSVVTPDGGSSGDAGASYACQVASKCDATPPVPAKQGWRHSVQSPIITAFAHRHRGRDLLLRPSDTAWVLGKFTYGTGVDKDLKDEDVKIYLDRGCGGKWEELGVATTTQDGAHATVEDVPDDGGQVYFQIPGKLPVGRHRIHMVVLGDLTTADQIIEVMPEGTKTFVTDVDGTLTTSENVEFTSLLTGTLPEANPMSADAAKALVAKGYRPIYLTARPAWLVERTREFVDVRGFPPGIIHTTLSITGALNGAAMTFKRDEIGAFKAKGFAPTYAIGNRDSDAEAFTVSGVTPPNCRLYQFTDATYGCKSFQSYGDLVTEWNALPACK